MLHRPTEPFAPTQPVGDDPVASVSHTLSVGAAEPMVKMAARDRLIWPASCLAVAAHAALILYAMVQDPDALSGGGGHELDAIGVTIVSLHKFGSSRE